MLSRASTCLRGVAPLLIAGLTVAGGWAGVEGKMVLSVSNGGFWGYYLQGQKVYVGVSEGGGSRPVLYELSEDSSMVSTARLESLERVERTEPIPEPLRGKYQHIFRRRDGKWVCVADRCNVFSPLAVIFDVWDLEAKRREIHEATPMVFDSSCEKSALYDQPTDSLLFSGGRECPTNRAFSGLCQYLLAERKVRLLAPAGEGDCPIFPYRPPGRNWIVYVHA